jgi:hypothetical protein
MKPTLLVICATGIAAAALAGCGEKSEPDLQSLAQQFRQQEEQAIVGSYHGTLHQQGTKPFQVMATVASLSDASKNVVHYTGIDCSGTWSFQKHEDGTYEFGEKIDRGAGAQCQGTGTVTLTPQGANRYGYEFRGGGVMSTGVLQRTD